MFKTWDKGEQESFESPNVQIIQNSKAVKGSFNLMGFMIIM